MDRRPTDPNYTTELAPVIDPRQTLGGVTDKISNIVLRRRPTMGWLTGLALSMLVLQVFVMSVSWLLYRGVGVWGINVPVAWGFAIVNFVWWIGIGHAGTLISAILLLLNQGWRNAISRFAEAMTLFAVACAGQFPLLHMGRPWLFYWLIPYPNTMAMWPQFRSPLDWDVFAVSTYATISIVFWYVGLIPDLASLARSRPASGISRLSSARCRSVGAGLRCTGCAMKRPACCSPAWRRRWCFRCTPSSASTLRSRSCPAGTPRSSRRTSSRAQFTRASPWC